MGEERNRNIAPIRKMYPCISISLTCYEATAEGVQYSYFYSHAAGLKSRWFRDTSDV